MNKGLDLIQRQQIEEIDGYPTGNVYIGLTCEELEELEKELKALEIIKNNFQLVDNCLHAKNPYGEDGWVFVKELEDEEEHNAWKEVLL